MLKKKASADPDWQEAAMKDEFDSLKKNKMGEQLEIEESLFLEGLRERYKVFFACGSMM